MSLLAELWWSGVHAAGGEQAVNRALASDTGRPFAATEVLSVGKAAASMCMGALDLLPAKTQALVVTKSGHAGRLKEVHSQVELIESGHPIPDVQSLLAGQRLHERVRLCPKDAHLLVLISGGASALAERLPPGMSLIEWQRKTQALVASGATIQQINAQRSKHSLIKSGRLLKSFGGAQVRVLAISDVEGDSLAVIGSGLGDVSLVDSLTATEVVASNATARAAIVEAAARQGIVVQENSETLYEDVFAVAQKMAQVIRLGPPGLYLWGGEPTIELPEKPGRGGRNQSLALALARELSAAQSAAQEGDGADALSVEVLVAGTDGTDGPTSAAGGWLRSASDCSLAELTRALDAADAGSWLASRNELFVTGPTDTNVMDLALCLKR